MLFPVLLSFVTLLHALPPPELPGTLKHKHVARDHLQESPMEGKALLYLVKKSQLSSWLNAQGPSAYLTRRGSVLFLHRPRRQSTGSGTGNAGGTSIQDTYKEKIVTPVLPIEGKKQYNETDCMPWEEVAVLLRDSMHPKHKSQYIEDRTCNMKENLECLPVMEKSAIVMKCRCQLNYGAKALYINYTDPTGRVYKACFVPAGLGWASECFAKPWNNYGYPLPFGDPAGTNAEAAIQVDAYNKEDGEQLVIEYIHWNSIKPKCVPFSECRERGTYQGQRCQCLKGHKPLKKENTNQPTGQCSGVQNTVGKAPSLRIVMGLMLMLGLR